MTSLHNARIRFQDTDFAADNPLDTALARAVVNNALFYADSAGQVRVAWTAAKTNYLEPDLAGAGAANGEPRHLATFGPFPVTLNTDGQPYTFRVRVAGFAETANAVTFHVAIGPMFDGFDLISEADDGYISASTASTTSAWIVGSATYCTVAASKVERGMTSQQTVVAVGSNPSDARWCLMAAHVWAESTDASQTEPRLTGLYVAEYIGL